jgi:hypothetical protein
MPTEIEIESFLGINVQVLSLWSSHGKCLKEKEFGQN